MPITEHDYEEKTRRFDGAILDAREKATETQHHALTTPDDARAHVAALENLINRQAELIAALRGLIAADLLASKHRTPADVAKSYTDQAGG